MHRNGIDPLPSAFRPAPFACLPGVLAVAADVPLRKLPVERHLTIDAGGWDRAGGVDAEGVRRGARKLQCTLVRDVGWIATTVWPHHRKFARLFWIEHQIAS